MDTSDRRTCVSSSAAVTTPELWGMVREGLTRFGELLEVVTADDLDQATPCDEWTVTDLIGHTIGLTCGLAEALRTGDAGVRPYRPRPISVWPQAVRDLGRVWDAWSESGVAGERRLAPVSSHGPTDLENVLQTHLRDIVTHGWDLARALRLDYDPGDEAASVLLDCAARVARRDHPSNSEHFGPPISVEDTDAGTWQRVLRLLGRDPAWRRPRECGEPGAFAPINIAERLTRFSCVWSPKIIARVNDHEIKVVKLSGEFVWHAHPDTDEVFIVVTGRMRIDMRRGSVALGPGDMYVIPRGVAHRPVATVPTEAILLDPVGVINTGDAGGPLTAVDEYIGAQTAASGDLAT